VFLLAADFPHTKECDDDEPYTVAEVKQRRKGWMQLLKALEYIGDKECMFGALRAVLVMRPLRGWARVRRVLRVRAIVVYWLLQTEELMAPNGLARKRDRDAFEADLL